MIRFYKILPYADDVTIFARFLRSMMNIFAKLEKRTKDLGLIINESKTKYFRVTGNATKWTKIFSLRDIVLKVCKILYI